MRPRYKEKALDKLIKVHRQKPRGTKVSIVYFSCERDFQLLRISILSISKHVDLDNIYITISEDYRNPFSSSQREQLKDIIHNIKFNTGLDVDKTALRTIENLGAMITEYHLAFRDDVKYVCKIDSDTIIMKDIFEEALTCDKDILGDMNEKHIDDGIIKHKWRALFQAGSYFLSRKCVKHLYELLKTNKLKETCDSMPDQYARYNEDHMFYSLSKYSFGGEVEHINYDLVVSHPLFLEYISDYYVLHFYTAKDLMLRVADKILGT